MADSAITYGCSLGILALIISNSHDYIRRIDNGLFIQGRSDFTSQFQVYQIGHCFISQIILASDGKSEIGRGDNTIMMLDDDFVAVNSRAFTFYSTIQIIVTKFNGKFKLQNLCNENVLK